ncbi:MAG: AAA family ATPase [Pirellula sp.]|jgi:SpoVK/Ycf46/Vps4 family AAA+-type ATPase|nr:AAA family ATPase [Pirellula sp.]
MTDPNNIALEALRNAIKLAPDNQELIDHLGRTLLALLRASEAAEVYRSALERHTGSLLLQLGLAESYWKSGKLSHALAIVETLIRGAKPDARAWVLHARLMQAEGDIRAATASYREGMELDPQLADSELESLLGLDLSFEDSEPPKLARNAWDQEEIDEPESEELAEIERPTITFNDVGGMDSVKEDIRVKIIYPMQHSEMFAAYGKRAGGGILMYGPPGCGKTLIARATAGEVHSRFMAIGINEVLDMYVGNSEKNLHALFEQARRNRPCVLFFDEVDALGASRSDMRRTGGRHLINQFLAELDGAQSDNEGLLCLGATNAPWHLDHAFKRPGRFDRMIFVPPPDEPARAEILTMALKGKPQQGIELAKVTAKTKDFSGADLHAIVDVAVEAKLFEAIKTGKPKPITTQDLIAAAKNHRATTLDWFAAARNHAIYSNEGGQYDPILQYLGVKR